MKFLSVKHYLFCIRFYVIMFILLSLSIVIIPIIDNDLFKLYGVIELVVLAILSPFIIFSIIGIIKTNNLAKGKLYIGRITGTSSSFSIIPMPRLSIMIKYDGNVVESHALFSIKEADKLTLNREVQFVLSKNKKKAYIIMLL